jgi:hypothetical protein
VSSGRALIKSASYFLERLACGSAGPDLDPTHTHRYRITVNVDVDGQLHSGSSVIECRINRKAKILPDAPPYAFESVGEAVFVDMGFGRMNGGKMARYS